VRQWLENYMNLKEVLEEICELNHHLLRREEEAPAKRARKRT